MNSMLKTAQRNKHRWFAGMVAGVLLLVLSVWVSLQQAMPVRAVSPDSGLVSRNIPEVDISGGHYSFNISAPQQLTATVTSSPTATGTVVPNLTLTAAVTPSSATIGEQFFFTIVVQNVGTVPATGVSVFDSFPVFIDVVNVLTSRGVVTAILHSVIVDIGVLNPNESVQIIITVRVNSTLPNAQTVNNVVNLTYDPQQLKTATVSYSLTIPPATSTSTATASPTATGTPPTVTATATNTVVATATATGTPPTPTPTGTITPNPVISMSVYPTSATINQQLSFTIIVRNYGTAPAVDAVLTDSLASYLDVQNVTTTKGTVTKTSHSATISIGTLNPNEVVTIVIPTYVNNSLLSTSTDSNIVTLTYNTNQVRTSSIFYTAIRTSVLPGTGELPIYESNTIPWMNLVTGVGLLGLAGMMLAIRKSQKPLVIVSVFIILTVLVLGVAACVPETNKVDLPADETSPGAFSNVQEVLPTPTRTLMPYRPAFEFATPEAIITLPSFPIPTPELQGTAVNSEESPDTTPIERIVIPALSVDTVVKYVPYDESSMTWLIEGLREEVAWLGESSWPGLGSNTVLAGHVTVRGLGNGPFRYLENLSGGDSVVLYTQEASYTYQVREQLVIDDTDLGVTLPTVKPQLTLITCTGWDDEAKIYRYRRVVLADLTNTEMLNRVGKGN